MNHLQSSRFPASPNGPLLMIEGSGDTSPLETDPRMIERAFRDHGALLLRGFRFDVSTFRTFAERLCTTSVFNESPNRAVLDARSNIQSVDLGTEPFPLHPELSREPWRPDACLFACLDPPASGGETTLCDGADIVNRLPPPLVAAMRDRQLIYIQPASPPQLEFWLGTTTPTAQQLSYPPAHCPYFFRDIGGGRVIRGFSRPLLHKPMFCDELAFGNFLLFARDFLKLPNFPRLDDGRPVPDAWLDAVREAAAPITYALTWRRGDILVLDNSRFMHGRRAIADQRERTIASYFGYVGFAPPDPLGPLDPLWRRGQFKPPNAPPRTGSGGPAPQLT